MEERRGEKANQKRVAIKKAALELILESGIRGAAMKDVADRSGFDNRAEIRHNTG